MRTVLLILALAAGSAGCVHTHTRGASHGNTAVLPNQSASDHVLDTAREDAAERR